METSLAIVSDTVWFTPALLVLTAMMALVLEVVHSKQHLLAGASAGSLPGGTRRLNFDDLNERFIIRLALTIGIAVVTGMAARMLAEGRNSPLVYAVMFGGSGLALALTLWTWRLVARWHASRLGFEGEQMVGRELNLLMLDGCRVFHDLAVPNIGNIDHIIVAPHAIFVVETLMLRQRRRSEHHNHKDQCVVYNGHALHFPGFTTDNALRRTARNARWLEKLLHQKTGLQLPVVPILTLPGWQVKRTTDGPVIVVSPKEISFAVVDKVATPIYDAQRQRIINLLDEKCQYTPI